VIAVNQAKEGRMTPSPRKDPLIERIAFLKQVPLFSDLADKDVSALIDDFRLREYAKDETIFHQGDHSYDLYIVMQGKVRIFKTSPSGEETSINVFASHDVIGEFSTIDSQRRSATAKALTRCALLEMTQDRFLHHMREIPDLALGMARLLVSKVRWTAAYAETIAQFDAAGRLLHILLLYNDQFGEEIVAGKRYELDMSLNQAGLASLVGARREWINRILRDWKKRGLITYDAGKIIILDLPAVERERDSRIEANRGQMEW
jgi:CRP-like cAMP-binding protein